MPSEKTPRLQTAFTIYITGCIRKKQIPNIFFGKRPSAKIAVFEVDADIHERIVKNLIHPKPAPRAKNLPHTPKLVDKTKSGFVIKLPKICNTTLEK